MEAEVSFGAWVVRQRKTLDLTRAELAHCAGCSVSALRKIEGDERRPSRQLAELLADCLHIPNDQRPTFLHVARGHLRVERLAAVVPQPTMAFGSTHDLPQSCLRLPTPPTPLIGRDIELTTLTRLLHDPQCRLLTLVCPGGIGKTRLAFEVASTQIERFSNRVYFVPPASLNLPEFIVPAIADALELMFSGPAASQIQLLNYLREKSLLLVLDNMEHLLEGAEVLATLLQEAPKVKLLVTSPERLNLQGEWLFDIQGLPVPPLDQVDSVEEYSSVELFLQSAQRVQAGFVLKAEERQAVSHIGHLVEGMPLAIQLAAAWVQLLSCQEIAEEIEHNLDFLATTMHDMPARHHSLRAAFDHSWNLLSEVEQSALSGLSVFRGGFTRGAAEQVAGASLFLLSALLMKSLVRRTEVGRYDLHELIRQYVAAHLGDHSRREAATRDQHSEFYLALLRDREVALKGTAQRETIRELTSEIVNMRAAWVWAVRQERFALLGPAMRSFGLLSDIWGWLDEGIEQLEMVVQALHGSSEDEARQTVLGQALAQQGLLFFRQGQHERAQSLFEESMTILCPIGDPTLLLEPLIFCGIVMYLDGEFGQARPLLDEGLTCAQAIGDPWFTALALFNLGYMASRSPRKI